jgi:hypothetical protein
VRDIDTAVVDSLKVLDPEWPIREADINHHPWHVGKVPPADMPTKYAAICIDK